jgi:hypothetical protein
MKTLLTILFFLTILTSWGQTTHSCETIYDFPQTLPQYTNNTTKGLMAYLSKKLVPILSGCIKQDREVVTSMHIKLTIDKAGKVIAVDFPRLQASEYCKEKLRNEILTMTGWTAGQMDGKNVCSKFYWPISCLKWEE